MAVATAKRRHALVFTDAVVVAIRRPPAAKAPRPDKHGSGPALRNAAFASGHVPFASAAFRAIHTVREA
jgi:hypothetical protein